MTTREPAPRIRLNLTEDEKNVLVQALMTRIEWLGNYTARGPLPATMDRVLYHQLRICRDLLERLHL